MQQGWFKMSRNILSDDVCFHDKDHLTVWCYLCANAAFQPKEIKVGSEVKTMQPGELLTTRKEIAEATDVNEYKVDRILSAFESAHKIAQQKSSKNRYISMLFESTEEESAHKNARILNSESTADAQRANTIKKEEKERKKDGNTYARTRAQANAGKKQNDLSIFSADASYDMNVYLQYGLAKLKDYQPKHPDADETAARVRAHDRTLRRAKV